MIGLLTKDIVTRSLQEFMDKWNQGDLEGACSNYTDDATFISSSAGYVHGKEQIMAGYRKAFKSPEDMGTLTLQLLELRPIPESYPPMATAVLSWQLDRTGAEQQKGYCLETYSYDDDRLRIVQDATI